MKKTRRVTKEQLLKILGVDEARLDEMRASAAPIEEGSKTVLMHTFDNGVAATYTTNGTSGVYDLVGLSEEAVTEFLGTFEKNTKETPADDVNAKTTAPNEQALNGAAGSPTLAQTSDAEVATVS